MKKTGLKLKEDCFTVSMENIIGEYPTEMYEVVKRKRQYKEIAPIHLSHFILSNAKEGFWIQDKKIQTAHFKNWNKLHMLQFVDMLIDYWKTDSLKLLYTGDNQFWNKSNFWLKILTQFSLPCPYHWIRWFNQKKRIITGRMYIQFGFTIRKKIQEKKWGNQVLKITSKTLLKYFVGVFKAEFQVTNGSFVGLSNKEYW